MTKLGEKLKELGYKLTKEGWRKRIKGSYVIELHIFTNNEVVGGIIQEDHFIMYRSQIKRLEQAFDQLQSDLKELEQCQD